MTKTLVAYYSYSGNTKYIAEIIQEKTGADIFEIETFKEYPANYNDVVKLAKQEKENEIKPELKAKLENIEDYDVIYLGTPVWWYSMASPIRTFIAENNMSGKVIKPFCTHGGGGASSTFNDMMKLIPNSEFGGGLVVFERGNDSTKNDIENWVK